MKLTEIKIELENVKKMPLPWTSFLFSTRMLKNEKMQVKYKNKVEEKNSKMKSRARLNA